MSSPHRLQIAAAVGAAVRAAADGGVHAVGRLVLFAYARQKR
ncbi:MAG TPA: hypothetical protein VLZ05_15415 [Mycobacterium sp.]|nr:hypothetical protein [Mycobacterium sp.]HUH70116.1 hypothetical protein [Mycobacterium sp.]